MQKIPTLVGTGGYVEGSRTPLEYGKTITVGRSRSADFSLRRLPKVADMTDEDREANHDLRTVSGKHFEITMYNVKSIEIVNLSPNGTVVDGEMVDKLIIEDVAERSHEIRMGSKEIFRLELAAHEEGGAEEGKPDEEAADKPDASEPDAKADDEKTDDEEADDEGSDSDRAQEDKQGEGDEE